MISSHEEILENLKTKIIKDERTRVLEGEIIAASSSPISIKAEAIKELNIKRMMASNTLIKEKASLKLAQWDEANAMLNSFLSEGRGFSLHLMSEINALFTKNSSYRSGEMYSADIQYLSQDKLHETLSYFEENYLKAESNFSPLELAFHLYQWSVTLHPFDNGNGRTARLMADWCLLKNGFLPLCFTSSIQSHVAYTINGRKTDKNTLYLRFLAGVKESYITVGYDL